MYTRRKRRMRKTKRGGLGTEVYIMGGVLLALTIGLTGGLSQFTGPYNDGNTEAERQDIQNEQRNMYAIENPAKYDRTYSE
jgi:hypothetical protein